MSYFLRYVGSRLIATSLIGLLSAPLVFAQKATSSTNGQSDRQQPLVGPVKPLMVERIGVDPNQIMRLSLHDAILMALQNNNTIQIERTNILGNEEGLRAARGAYDISISASIQAETPKTPSNSTRFVGVDLNGDGAIDELDNISDGRPLPVDLDGDGIADNTVLDSDRRKTAAFNFTAQQQLPYWGAAWRFQIDTNRFNTDTSTFSFGGFSIGGVGFAVLPQYQTSVTTEFQLPLWKNFRIDQSRRQIKIASKALDLSDSQFRQRVIDIITQVQQAYWDLVFAIRAVEIQQEALKLAETNLNNNRKQVEAGTLAPIELAQSQAQVEQSQQSLTAAIGAVTVRENILKGLILGNPTAAEWRANIAPTESIDHLPAPVDFESALKLAQANRPELEQLRLRREQNAIDIKYYANQSKPQIDLFARYRMSGLAGEARPSTISGLVPQPGGGFFTDNVTTQVPNQYQGGAFTSLKNAFTNDFYTYSFGLRFNFPLRNRTALGLLGQAKAQGRALEFQEQQLLQNISIEVRNALQQVETSRRSIEAARAARINRQIQLEGEQKKFEAGLSTTFFVLQFQNFLSEARLQELQALVNYNKAIADLQRVMSTTLTTHNVEISPRLDR
ncbi:MAG: TolC family protein [Blastocatellia bacterium]|nr:TolC family protein [Blastocatellia bacterium]